MIVQVRGTSGSGKSTAVRRFMEGAEWQARHKPPRKRPLWYCCVSPDWPAVSVLGHYETDCGGCDTLGSAKAVFDAWESLRTDPLFGTIVVMEGLLLSEDVKWTAEMARADEVLALFLTTPADRCLAQITARRAGAGVTEPFNEARTTTRMGTIDRARVKLSDAGVTCRRCSASQAPGLIMEALRLHAERERRG